MTTKKSESKYVSALPKILNGPSLLTWRSAMCSIIFGPFRLLGNAHLFSWLFRWPVGVDMWCRSCRPEVWTRWRVREKILRIENVWSLNVVEFKCERRHIPNYYCTHPISAVCCVRPYGIIFNSVSLTGIAVNVPLSQCSTNEIFQCFVVRRSSVAAVLSVLSHDIYLLYFWYCRIHFSVLIAVKVNATAKWDCRIM